MRRAAAYVLLACAVAAVAWAVTFSRLPPADFTFCNGDEIKTVDPATVTGEPEGRIVRALFEGLCRWDPKTLEPIPGVAESWDISKDNLTYTFHLRPDARWSDGSPVTAEDFVWSFRRFLHPATGAQYSYELWYPVGAQKYTTARLATGDPVEIELPPATPGTSPFSFDHLLRGRLVAVDEQGEKKTYTVEIDGHRRQFRRDASGGGLEDYRWLTYDWQAVGIRPRDSRTLEIQLSHPVPYFVKVLGFYPLFPVNRRCVEKYGYPAWTKPGKLVGNGPFILEFRRIRDRIRLRKSPTYWDRQHVRLEVVDALAVKSYATMLNLYMSGQADWITSVPTEVIPDLLRRKEKDFQPVPFFGTYFYRFNTRKPPLDDARVRRALALVINKREIVEKITRAGQIPATSLVPEAISQYLDYRPARCEPYDIAKARKLLAQAGYPGGRGLPKLEILYNTSEAHKAIAELIQSQWKRALGIDIGLQNQEWAAYLSSCRQGRYLIARAAWIGDYVDPNTFLDLFVTDGTNNETGWGNPKYDRLLAAARQETDPQRRFENFHQAERILMDEMPIVPIYFYVTQSMVRPYVKGFYENIQDEHPLKDIWIDQEEKVRVMKEEGLR